MQIQFDPNQMHLQVICGIEEDYKPNRRIKKIQEKVAALKKEMEQFMLEIIDPELETINKMIEEENKKYHSVEVDDKLKPKDKAKETTEGKTEEPEKAEQEESEPEPEEPKVEPQPEKIPEEDRAAVLGDPEALKDT